MMENLIPFVDSWASGRAHAFNRMPHFARPAGPVWLNGVMQSMASLPQTKHMGCWGTYIYI